MRTPFPPFLLEMRLGYWCVQTTRGDIVTGMYESCINTRPLGQESNIRRGRLDEDRKVPRGIQETR